MMPTTRATEVTTPSDREVRITRSFDAPRHLVFECWTRPALLRRWLLGPPGWSMTTCDVDLRVGGEYRYVWSHTDGETLAVGGVFRQILPPERLVTVEKYDEDWTGGETVVTLDLTETAGRTVSTTTILYASKEARDGAVATGMAEGMGAGYERLDVLLLELR